MVCRRNTPSAGADHQLVVWDLRAVAEGQPPSGRVDAAGDRVQPKVHAGGFQLRQAAVSQGLPAWHVAGHVIRDATDREVGEPVGDDHGHVRVGSNLPGAQRGRDAGVAAAHR
jgi:hypothetical protein